MTESKWPPENPDSPSQPEREEFENSHPWEPADAPPTRAEEPGDEQEVRAEGAESYLLGGEPRHLGDPEPEEADDARLVGASAGMPAVHATPPPGRPFPNFAEANRSFGVNAAPASPAGAGAASLGSLHRFTWLLAVVVLLLAVRLIVPGLIEETRFAWKRGQQRAEYDTANVALRDDPLQGLSRAYQLVAQKVSPSVVHIYTASADQNAPGDPQWWFRQPPRFQAQGQGSGVIVDSQGYILTNQHVISGAEEIHVVLSDGRTVLGELLSEDAPTDLALVKIPTTDLIAAEWGESDELEVGSLVWAVGSPFGLEHTVTFGILSAKNRAGLAGTAYQDFLQTDAAVNPGNSGGPLVDGRGRVVGINTAIVGQAYQGISFAIPSSIARRVYGRLRTEGEVVRGWLGVALDQVTPAQAEQWGLPEARGALVQQVVDGLGPSPARRAGILAGDVIVRWNKRVIDQPATLSRLVGETEVGSETEVVLYRDGEEVTLSVTVGRRPRHLN